MNVDRIRAPRKDVCERVGTVFDDVAVFVHVAIKEHWRVAPIWAVRIARLSC